MSGIIAPFTNPFCPTFNPWFNILIKVISHFRPSRQPRVLAKSDRICCELLQWRLLQVMIPGLIRPVINQIKDKMINGQV